MARSAVKRLTELAEENPMRAAAVGLAIGLAVGLVAGRMSAD